MYLTYMFVVTSKFTDGLHAVPLSDTQHLRKTFVIALFLLYFSNIIFKPLQHYLKSSGLQVYRVFHLIRIFLVLQMMQHTNGVEGDHRYWCLHRPTLYPTSSSVFVLFPTYFMFGFIINYQMHFIPGNHQLFYLHTFQSISVIGCHFYNE